MRVLRESFGNLPNGGEVAVFVVTNPNGYELRCTSLGASILGLRGPDRDGAARDLMTGPHEKELILSGAAPAGSHLVRPGPTGNLWDAMEFCHNSAAGVLFSVLGPAAGGPGLQVGVSISLTASDELVLEYRAETESAAPVEIAAQTCWALELATNFAPVDPGGGAGDPGDDANVRGRNVPDTMPVPSISRSGEPVMSCQLRDPETGALVRVETSFPVASLDSRDDGVYVVTSDWQERVETLLEHRTVYQFAGS